MARKIFFSIVSVLLLINGCQQPRASQVEDAKAKKEDVNAPLQSNKILADEAIRSYEPERKPTQQEVPMNTESYNLIVENDFLTTIQNPLSTFSIDVDKASYSNARRYLQSGQLPPKDAIRIEEFVNYFEYDYPEPKNERPFAVYTEVSECPWNTKNQLIHIGLKAKKLKMEQSPAINLVFLIDVSGSMSDANKLPLLKNAFSMLVENLREQDRVSMVVYAGAAGVVLPSTSGANKKAILEALEKLNAGGSTAGGEGIRLAYQIAKDNFIKGGNNRVILATDGDFNVGESSDGAMTRLVEEKRETGIFLTTLGFGMGNYKDSKMETLADKGNGNYFYIDNLSEAKKVLVKELTGTLFAVAKDVKLQVEFNPTQVQSYRLIGYENRLMKAEDFNDDKKDAGEIGAGHTVTALYEVVPVQNSGSTEKVNNLKYQETNIKPTAYKTDEMMTVHLRYKNPDANESKLFAEIIKKANTPFKNASLDHRFAATVASFGMLLRDSKYKGNLSYENVLETARNTKGEDKEGYRAEFIELIKTAQKLQGNTKND